MRTLTCRNSTILRPLAHFETVSTAAATLETVSASPGISFPLALAQFSHMPQPQVSAPVAAVRDARCTCDAVKPVPLSAAVRIAHTIAGRMGLQRAESFSPQCTCRELASFPEAGD
jgi:hypothetical protein